MKFYFLLIFSFVNFFYNVECIGQINVDDVNGWKSKTDSALSIIRQTDIAKYNTLIKTCSHIGYWSGNSSTIEEPSTILISNLDMANGSVNDVAAAIVHESKHLYYLKTGTVLDTNTEELYAYQYELEFIRQLPNVEEYLIQHCLKMINLFSKQ
jgi:hypothetical protein